MDPELSPDPVTRPFVEVLTLRERDEFPETIS
jgi:hypothetical protein